MKHPPETRKSLVIAACGVFVLAAALLHADTIFLKDGTQILDCKVTAETDTRVTVRTPVGDMVVPRSAIERIQRQKSAYDLYAERLAEIREGDVNGLFKLAEWCRTTEGLRKEADELLARVIALKGDHVEARRLLGHVRVGGEWTVPPPLSIRLKTSGGGKDAEDLRERLSLFLESRLDVRVASGDDAASGPGAGAGDPLESCTLDAAVVIARKAPPTFYGVSLGGPSYYASVTLRAQGAWIGKTPLKAAVAGQVPGNGGSVSLAIQNALGSNSASVHRFLDRLTRLRAQKLEAELRKQKPAKRAGAADAPKA